LGLFQIIVQVA